MKNKKNIKICFVTREYALDELGETGGIGVFVRNISLELIKHGFEVYIFYISNEKKEYNDYGVKIYANKNLQLFKKVLSFWKRINFKGSYSLTFLIEYVKRYVNSIQLSVFCLKKGIHIVEFSDYCGDTPYYIGLAKAIIRCHGCYTILNIFMGYPYRRIEILFEKKLFKKFSKNVISVSNSSKKMICSTFHFETSPTVISNSIDLKQIKKIVGVNYLATNNIEAFSIYYFGSVRKQKGIDIAIDVFNKVIINFPKASFHIIGNNNKNYWSDVAINNLSEKSLSKTKYYGSIAHPSVLKELNKSQIVIFPSFGETYSIALREAMFLGKIVIVSNIPAFTEIINHEENGFIAKSTGDYVNIIHNIFNNKYDIESIRNHAVQIIEDNFDIKNLIYKNITYYKQLINN